MIYIVSNVDKIEDSIINVINWQKVHPSLVNKINSFKFDRDKKIEAVTYLLFNYVCLINGINLADREIYYTKYGKPYLKVNDSFQYNLSHCTNTVACIIDWTPVGIDVQNIEADIEEIAEDICSKKEYISIEALTKEERKQQLTLLWTLKESYLKKIGFGLINNLAVLDFSDCMHEGYFAKYNKQFMVKRLEGCWMSSCSINKQIWKEVCFESLLYEDILSIK